MEEYLITFFYIKYPLEAHEENLLLVGLFACGVSKVGPTRLVVWIFIEVKQKKGHFVFIRNVMTRACPYNIALFGLVPTLLI